jgi:hypothetical protein
MGEADNEGTADFTRADGREFCMLIWRKSKLNRRMPRAARCKNIQAVKSKTRIAEMVASMI